MATWIAEHAAYLAGLLTLPLLVGAGYVLRGIVRACADLGRWLARKPLFLHDEKSRRNNAAAILTARRVLAVVLPGGVVLAWRTNVRWLEAATWQTDVALRAAKRALAKRENEGGEG